MSHRMMREGQGRQGRGYGRSASFTGRLSAGCVVIAAWFLVACSDNGGEPSEGHAGAGGSAGGNSAGGKSGAHGGAPGAAGRHGHSGSGNESSGGAPDHAGTTGSPMGGETSAGGDGSGGSGIAGTCGASGSGGASGGSTGSSGSSDIGGTNSGGGDTSVGGNGGSGGSGAAGGSNPESGGANTGGGGDTSVSGSGGSNAASGGIGGIAGTSGSAGLNSGGSGNNAGILTLSTAELDFVGTCTSDPQTFTITNTGSVPVSWTGTASAQTKVLLSFDPTGSTLMPGAAVSVTVTLAPFVAASSGWLGVISIASDATVEPTQSVALLNHVAGSYITLPADVDFGAVAIGATKSIHIEDGVPTSGLWFETALSTNKPDFASTSGPLSHAQGWTLTFAPTSAGPQTAVCTEIMPFGGEWPLCPPNTFNASGIGFYDTTCTLVPDRQPCGVDDVCQGGICRLTLQPWPFPLTFSFEPGVASTGDVARFGNVQSADPANAYTAVIDWGDGSSSGGIISAVTFGFIVSGTHTYSTTAPVTGTVTVTHIATAATLSTPFNTSVGP